MRKAKINSHHLVHQSLCDGKIVDFDGDDHRVVLGWINSYEVIISEEYWGYSWSTFDCGRVHRLNSP